jgi:polysaccharide transporter, PST family
MKLSAKIFYYTMATSVSIAVGFLRNKIFALYLAFTVFGILSIAQQSIGLFFTLFAFGFPLAFATMSAELVTQTSEIQRETVSKMIVLVLMVGLGTGLFIAGLLYFQLSPLVYLITNNLTYAPVIIILFCSIPFMVIQYSLVAILEGRGMVKEVVYFKMVPSILGLPILLWLVYQFQLIGAAFGIVINECLFMMMGLFLLRGWIRFSRESLRIHFILSSVYKLAFLTALVSLGGLAVDFIVKRYILGIFGEYANGIIQSVSKITDLYPTIALSWLIVHLFPELVKNYANKSVICQTIERTVLIAVTLTVPIIIVLFAFRGTVLEILYRHDFRVATDYFGAMLAIGIPKVVAGVVSLSLLPLNLKREWFYSSMISIAGYAFGVWLGVSEGFGIFSIPIAYGISMILQLMYVLAVYRHNQILFANNFYNQLGLIGLISVVIIFASYHTAFLWLTCVLFLWMIWRYKLIMEIKDKLFVYFK